MDIVFAFMIGIAISFLIAWFFWGRQSGPSTIETTSTKYLIPKPPHVFIR